MGQLQGPVWAQGWLSCWGAAIQKSAFGPETLNQGALVRQTEASMSCSRKDPQNFKTWSWMTVGEGEGGGNQLESKYRS